jgi:hypothetical protein
MQIGGIFRDIPIPDRFLQGKADAEFRGVHASLGSRVDCRELG